jgi:hypothetical protein
MKKLVFTLLMILAPFFAFAALVPCGGPGDDPCTLCDFVVLVDRVVKFLVLILILPAGVVGLMIAGVLLLTAGGNAKQLEKGKSIFRQVLIGMVIAFAAWLVIDTILRGLLEEGYFQSWAWNEFPTCELFK